MVAGEYFVNQCWDLRKIGVVSFQLGIGFFFFFFSSRRRHTRWTGDWSSDVCSSDLKALEEHGIGRPSTYATIISTLKDREYVDMDNRRFIPTDIGKIVNGFLSKHFHKYVEYGFTAALEDELDAVSRGEEPWTEPLKKFWKPFVTLVDHVEKNVSREEVAQARELGKDPVSGKPITVRMGRYGPFVQIGTKDDEEKPKFAGLRPGQKMDLIKLPEALELFKLPRKLGATAEGEPVEANIGRFGPYIKYGAK